MEALALPFFPFPHFLSGERRAGYRFSWPDRCNHCDRQCEKLQTTQISLCSYGVNYIWLQHDLLVFGFLIRDPAPSSAQKKLFRTNPKNIVTVQDVESAVQVYNATIAAFEQSVRRNKDAIIEDFVKTKRYEREYLEILKPEIQASFAFVHDYKQFIARVRQNINVVIETRYSGVDFETKLERALPSEAAIYWASILMEEKLRTAYLLLNPDQITNDNKRTVFRLHGLVLKNVRIYNAAFAAKNVTLHVYGESIGEVRGNSVAVSVIPHTLIDNALKYSKPGSDVRIEFRETTSDIELRVTSFGPQIAQDELDKIFDLFYRGRRARDQEEEGAGFGLYLAQFIAREMGTQIIVSQEAGRNKDGLFKTTFAVKFQRQVRR